MIADDAVEIKKVSSKTIVGSAPEMIRHYIELRGIGVVDVRRLFGVGAVKDTEKIDLVIKLEPWVCLLYTSYSTPHSTSILADISPVYAPFSSKCTF